MNCPPRFAATDLVAARLPPMTGAATQDWNKVPRGYGSESWTEKNTFISVSEVSVKWSNIHYLG